MGPKPNSSARRAADRLRRRSRRRQAASLGADRGWRRRRRELHRKLPRLVRAAPRIPDQVRRCSRRSRPPADGKAGPDSEHHLRHEHQRERTQGLRGLERESARPSTSSLSSLSDHGTAQGSAAKLCLPGPDLTSDETADLLNKIPTKEVLFINTAACSAAFLEKCSAPGRIVITSTNNAGEGNETYFMEFLPARLKPATAP